MCGMKFCSILFLHAYTQIIRTTLIVSLQEVQILYKLCEYILYLQ